MVSLLVSWILFPVVLGAVSIGCALLLERALGLRLPGALLPGAGLAIVIVVGQFLTWADATAELVSPAVVAMAVAGFGLGWRRDWGPRSEVAWAALLAVSVFAVYAAPIVLSGEATFAGYIKLDDTATWLAFTDQVMEHGRDVGGLDLSTHEALVQINLAAAGYPVGVFIPLGVGSQLLGQDPAWLLQPYMALFAAVLALALWSLGSNVVRSRGILAAAIFLAAQPALLFGYYLWGGIKEVAAAALIATAAALALAFVKSRADGADPAGRPTNTYRRALVPLAIVSAALVGILGGGGAIWIFATVAVTVASIANATGTVAALLRAVEFAAFAALLSLPVILTGGLQLSGAAELTNEAELGNLFEPLKLWQLAGIWPAGDFRVDPGDPGVTFALIVVAIGAAVAGVAFAARARAWEVVTFVVGTLLACLAIVAIGSPWIDGKVLAIASPAILFAACLAGAALVASGRRIEGVILLGVLAAGILWSTGLAYRDVNLAPRDQLAELEEIGELTAGRGPTLMTEYQPYGARHFLREGDAEGLTELRRRPILLRDGTQAEPHSYVDIDEVDLGSLLFYPTLVLRRNPTRSRPPSPYELTWRGEYYEVWELLGSPAGIVDQLPLGDSVDPAAVPDCERVRGLADEAGQGGSLAAALRTSPIAVGLQDTNYPPSWLSPDLVGSLLPTGAGTISTVVDVPAPGDYEFWLGGSVLSGVELRVDGERAGSVRHEINNTGQYILLGDASLEPGAHSVQMRFQGADLHPGSGGKPFPIGPLIVSQSGAADSQIVRVPADDAGQLCGKPWDWIEAIQAPEAPKPAE